MKQPDIDILNQWFSGELEGELLSQVESWANENPELAESMATEFMQPVVELEHLYQPDDVPYPDFFNKKLEQQIFVQEASLEEAAVIGSKPRWMQRLSWLFAPVALAAMALCFYLGTQYSSGPSSVPVMASTRVEPLLIYVPSESVKVEVIESEDASMIVLDGLEPFSDDDITVASHVVPGVPEDNELILVSNNHTGTWF